MRWPRVDAVCSVCDLPVKRDEMEFEIQFDRGGDLPGLDKFHVHIRCFAAWEFVRTKSHNCRSGWSDGGRRGHGPIQGPPRDVIKRHPPVVG
jgi:hypothetical protein